MRTILLLLAQIISFVSFCQSLHLENDPSGFIDNLNTEIPDKNFGGVSGIEYVPGTNKWFFITDGTGPGRPSYLFEIGGTGKHSYPDWKQAASRKVTGLTQAEAIRFDGKQFWIGTEEGVEPTADGKSDIFEKGTISVSQLNGQEWSMGKPYFDYSSNLNNRGHEALAIAGNDTIVTISEWPFTEDGRYARLKLMDCKTAPCRIIAEYAYELDINSCVADGKKADGSLGNGISEMLYISEGRYLIMERCFDGRSATVKLYETRITADITDVHISDFKALARSPAFRPLPKQEVFNFSSIKNLKIDNLEGMTWGPGRKTIAVISDNNFEVDTSKQKTQWIVLKVLDSK